MTSTIKSAVCNAVILTLMGSFTINAWGDRTAPVIVVTPTRIEIPLVRSAVPVEVITREEIQNSLSTDIAEIIERQSGLEVARNGGNGSVTSLFTRGSESNHTVILIDGVKINPATLGAPALQNISPAIIERIEIVKGPRSSVYGSEAIGGVVNIITRKQVYGRQSTITLGAGQNASKKLLLNSHFGSGNLSTGIALEKLETEGFPVTDLSLEDHGYDNQTLNAFINYRTDKHQLNLRHWQSKGAVEYYSFGEQDQDFKNSATAVHWDAALTDTINSSFRISHIVDDIDQNVANFLSELDYATTDRNELDVKLDYALESDSVFSAGLLMAKEEVDALSYGTLIDETTDIDETYLLYHSQVGAHNYALSYRQTDHEDFENHDTWNLDYQYQLDPGVSLYTGLGTAFRSPDHTDRFGSLGNPELKPETSKNLELALIFNFSQDSRFQVSLFQTKIDDLIEPNASFTQMINVDESEITGIELNYRISLSHWSYQFNALLQEPINQTTDEILSRRAQATVKTRLEYRQPDWQLGVSTIIVSARDDSSFNSITLPQYEVFDLTGTYRFRQGISLSVKIDNVFNEQYQTAYGFNTPDRTLMIELEYQFGS